MEKNGLDGETSLFLKRNMSQQTSESVSNRSSSSFIFKARDLRTFTYTKTKVLVLLKPKPPHRIGLTF